MAAAALFILIGARPRTDWLPTEIERDESGYLLTGREGGLESLDGDERARGLRGRRRARRRREAGRRRPSATARSQ